MNNVQDSGGGQGPSGQDQDEGNWFKQRRRGGNKQAGPMQQQGDSRRRSNQVPPPPPPRGEAQHKPRPMTERECLYLERSGGCKACKAIHPLRLCPHPDGKRISQRFHEGRLKQQAAKRSKEGHSGVTPEGKKPLLETGRTSPSPQRWARRPVSQGRIQHRQFRSLARSSSSLHTAG